VHRRKGRSSNDYTNYYFSHFPENYEAQDSCLVFSRWGKVKEVFTAPRRNKEGWSFGFGRFWGVLDEKEL